ncbi:hypothetical protein VP01_1395g1 [Puccinia sorghi]|uniref:Uncharacterized protein n=1 Tax=Puccinia sorghi TaxID=27349 RepID=A0A0L6VL33_9BASI|nr:hypothetical protein VP01_1395g1 [Puccinia sorghi]
MADTGASPMPDIQINSPNDAARKERFNQAMLKAALDMTPQLMEENYSVWKDKISGLLELRLTLPNYSTFKQQKHQAQAARSGNQSKKNSPRHNLQIALEIPTIFFISISKRTPSTLSSLKLAARHTSLSSTFQISLFSSTSQTENNAFRQRLEGQICLQSLNLESSSSTDTALYAGKNERFNPPPAEPIQEKTLSVQKVIIIKSKTTITRVTLVGTFIRTRHLTCGARLKRNGKLTRTRKKPCHLFCCGSITQERLPAKLIPCLFHSPSTFLPQLTPLKLEYSKGDLSQRVKGLAQILQNREHASVVGSTIEELIQHQPLFKIMVLDANLLVQKKTCKCLLKVLPHLFQQLPLRAILKTNPWFIRLSSCTHAHTSNLQDF